MCEERERAAWPVLPQTWGWNVEVPAATGAVLTLWGTLREASRRPCCGLSWQMGGGEPHRKRQPQCPEQGRPVLSRSTVRLQGEHIASVAVAGEHHWARKCMKGP